MASRRMDRKPEQPNPRLDALAPKEEPPYKIPSPAFGESSSPRVRTGNSFQRAVRGIAQHPKRYSSYILIPVALPLSPCPTSMRMKGSYLMISNLSLIYITLSTLLVRYICGFSLCSNCGDLTYAMSVVLMACYIAALHYAGEIQLV
jgi:hypothetical protein